MPPTMASIVTLLGDGFLLLASGLLLLYIVLALVFGTIELNRILFRNLEGAREPQEEPKPAARPVVGAAAQPAAPAPVAEPVAAVVAAAPAPVVAPAPPPPEVPAGLPPELVAVLMAAAAAALGRPVRVTRILINDSPESHTWAEHGRLLIQTSHRLRKGSP